MRIRTSLALGLLLVLTAAGCAKGTGGDGVASAGGATPTASASSASGSGQHGTKADQEQFLQFAQCMRDHGVPMDDPQFDGGGISLMIPEGTDKTKVDAAQAECKQYMPNGGEPPKLDAAQQEAMRKFAQCMRDQGITNFPDPSEDGGFMIDSGNIGIDPKSEQFKAAENACAQYRPKGPGGEGGEGDRSEHVENGGGGA